MREPITRYAILGDIHANFEALTAVLEDARKQGCNGFACVGDVVGYNASPAECVALIRELGMPCVKGNHDEYASSDIPLPGVSPRASAAIQWTRQVLSEDDKAWLRQLRYSQTIGGFTIVHATLDVPQRWGYVLDRLTAAASLTYQNTPVCFFGHTHLPMAFVRNGSVTGGPYSTFSVEPGRKYFVNSGSVGEPRDGSPLAAYVLYDLPGRTIELRRVPYDFERRDAKLKDAGLPPARKR